MNFGACIMTINWKSGIWVALLTAVLSACGGGKESNSTTAPPPVVVPPVVTLQSVAVIPANVTVVVGGKQTFSVTGAYSDGTTKALTTGLTWSANGTTVSVDAVTGEATARAVGTGAVTVVVGGFNGMATVTVVASGSSAGVVTPYLSVGGGTAHSLGVKTDGSLRAWGWNQLGQLGDGTMLDRTAPIPVGASKLWTRVAAGEYHSVGLMSDGTLWSWGLNLNGQLGAGNFNDLAVPTLIGKDKWVDFSVGKSHVLAVKTDGTL